MKRKRDTHRCTHILQCAPVQQIHACTYTHDFTYLVCTCTNIQNWELSIGFVPLHDEDLLRTERGGWNNQEFWCWNHWSQKFSCDWLFLHLFRRCNLQGLRHHRRMRLRRVLTSHTILEGLLMVKMYTKSGCIPPLVCVSTSDSRGHSWPPSAVEEVYRDFALDHGTCHAFLYACNQIFCRPSNSLYNHSMRASESRKASISFCAKSSAESSDISGWLGHAPLSLFHVLPTSLVALMSPCPSNLGTGTRHWCLAYWTLHIFLPSVDLLDSQRSLPTHIRVLSWDRLGGARDHDSARTSICFVSSS